MIEFKMLLDYIVLPFLLYLAYLHKKNINLEEDILKIQIKQSYQDRSFSDLESIKKDVHRLVIYFDIEHDKNKRLNNEKNN
jgi:hypothetical protein